MYRVESERIGKEAIPTNKSLAVKKARQRNNPPTPTTQERQWSHYRQNSLGCFEYLVFREKGDGKGRDQKGRKGGDFRLPKKEGLLATTKEIAITR